MVFLTMPVKIETERLLLQRLRYEDAEEIFYSYASKPEATRYLSWATHKSVDETRTFLNYAVNGWNYGLDYSYSIRLRSGVLIGSIGVIHDDGKLQIGYVVGPNYWNQGYTTEACRKMLSIAGNFPGIYRIGTFVDAENIPSVRVLEKCGMIEEARLPKWFRFVNQNNEPRDCILFRYRP